MPDTLTPFALCAAQANAKALETTMRGDVATAKVELQETKDAIPAEEERIFADLRKKAG